MYTLACLSVYIYTHTVICYSKPKDTAERQKTQIRNDLVLQRCEKRSSSKIVPVRGFFQHLWVTQCGDMHRQVSKSSVLWSLVGVEQ